MSERSFKIGYYPKGGDSGKLTQDYGKVEVEFDEVSTIKFFGEEGDFLMGLQPNDVKVLYAAICQMEEEEIRLNKLRK
jgi:hypothetical protein